MLGFVSPDKAPWEPEELPEDAAGIRYRCPQLAECLKERTAWRLSEPLNPMNGQDPIWMIIR